jgi:pimeloyl-ACP methyl ester carboxylesterase
LFVPLSHALADPGSPSTVAGQFLDFWRIGLSGLDQWPLDPLVTAEGRLEFTAHGGSRRWAVLTVPPTPLGLVVHLTNAETPQPVPAADGRAHCVFAWLQDAPAGPESPFDTRRHPVYRAILDSCRLLEALGGLRALQGLPVGVLGEGYGATVALAVAALMPDKVAFVVAHEPVCVGTAVREQAERAGVDLMLPSAGLKGLLRLSPSAFAPSVRAGVLMTVGLEDDLATPRTVVAAYDKLRCDKRIISLEGMGHCPASDIPDWEPTWREWAYAPA